MKHNMKSKILFWKRVFDLPIPYRKIYKKVYSELKEDIRSFEERDKALNDLLDMIEGAVQNNVCVEDLFPEGYESFYNDLVLSLPSYTGEIRWKRSQKRRFTVCFLIFFAIAFISGVLLYINGWFGVKTQGIAYIAGDLNHYSYNATTLEDKIEFTIDVKNPSANIGKIIYQNQDCYIEVEDVQIDGKNSVIYFRSHGIYSYKGATLISGLKHNCTEERYFTYSCEAKMQNKSNDAVYNCSIAGSSGLNYNDGDMFGFYVFSEEYFQNENIDGAENVDFIELVLYNVIQNQWKKK